MSTISQTQTLDLLHSSLALYQANQVAAAIFCH